ncbi:MAG: lytic transglycosylase domain-containing protein [bacterium]|nr:lytic transglycosylase domain-containing protein [bacterium]
MTKKGAGMTNMIKYFKKTKIIFFIPLALFFIANLFYYSSPALAVNDSLPNWTMPDLQIDIGGLKDILKNSKPLQCGTDQAGNQAYCINWIGEYIAGIYKYAIGIVGILAAVVLMIGGLLWIVAGGNATAIGEAKAWIGASLTGLIIALASYMILYQVNPDLLNLKPIRVAVVKKTEVQSTALNCQWRDGYNVCPQGEQITAGQCGSQPPENLILQQKTCCCATSQPPATSSDISVACQSYKYDVNSNFIDYNKITQTASLPKACSDSRFDFGFTGNSKLLKSIAAAESNCNPSAQSPAEACGLMQLVPDTAQSIVNKHDLYNKPNITCEWLKLHYNESIEIAGYFISDNYSSHDGIPNKIFGGYNSGYAITEINGKKAALVPSEHCPGRLAYECCILPGGLVETQNYVVRAKKYFNGLR